MSPFYANRRLPIRRQLQILTLHPTGTVAIATKPYAFSPHYYYSMISALFLVETWERERMQKRLQTLEVPDAESWLVKYKAKNSGGSESKRVETVWTYPTQLEMRTDLPPSIKKFSPEDFVDGDFSEWGE